MNDTIPGTVMVTTFPRLPWRGARRYYAAAAGLLLACLALLMVALPASAAVHSGPVKVPMCSAARTWSAHRTEANLDALMISAVYAPWTSYGVFGSIVFNESRDAGHADPSDVADMLRACKGH